jgi:predicted nucleic acid-binding protein
VNDHDFLDTNVLVYAYNQDEPKKQRIARQLTGRAVRGEFTISVQVLVEFASVLLHRVKPPLGIEEVTDALHGLGPIPLIKPDADMVRRAVEARAVYGIHFYDGMIVAAAERAGAETILSEDLNAGQEYFGVKVVNPFLES